jgi:hypothetical protein
MRGRSGSRIAGLLRLIAELANSAIIVREGGRSDIPEQYRI